MPVSDTEDVVTALVAGLAYVERKLRFKSLELQERKDVSQVTCTLETWQNELCITGYVDAALEWARGVAWRIDLWRRGSTWEVDRDVTLYPDEGEDVVNSLPLVECDSRELGRVLPALIDELLNLPVPELPGSGTDRSKP